MLLVYIFCLFLCICLDKLTPLMNVIKLDVSYNHLSNLRDLPSLFPNVKHINASFNEISSLDLREVSHFIVY